MNNNAEIRDGLQCPLPIENIKEWDIVLINSMHCLCAITYNGDCFIINPPSTTWREAAEIFLRIMDDVADCREVFINEH